MPVLTVWSNDQVPSVCDLNYTVLKHNMPLSHAHVLRGGFCAVVVRILPILIPAPAPVAAEALRAESGQLRFHDEEL